MEIALTFLGAILAILTTGIVENLRRPRLKLNVGRTEDDKYVNRPAQFKRAVRLEVENLPLPSWAGWMLRNPALQCNGLITFHHMDGQNVFGKSMAIRWPESPEPIPLIFQIDGKQAAIIDPARMVLEQRKDIFPGEKQEIDVACRFDQDDDCYGWNNESYFSYPLWRNPSWKLPKGRYLISVILFSSGQKCKGLFRLINDVGIEHFRIENALPEDYKNARIAADNEVTTLRTCRRKAELNRLST